jgi:hypothetical protein
LINNAHSPEQLRAVIDTLNKDIDGQQKANDDRLKLIHAQMSEFGTSGDKPAGKASSAPDNDPFGFRK